jgi:trk system potassium uptake protein TrkH
MNFTLIAKSLGIVSLLIGASMALCLPWTLPVCSGTPTIEWNAIGALAASVAIAVFLGMGLLRLGHGADNRMFRKEALAVVGLSWCLASALGAAPFLLSGTCKGHNESADAAGPPGDVRMSVVDALFESVSGFSGTGATVITDLEDPQLVPRAILFWRSATHFLGGLGIMVLFVALLGQGSAGKAIFRAELPGPSKDVGHSRAQHAAWIFAGIYLGLNATLTILLLAQGVSLFDALCHAFGTIATGGFSTYNDSVGHFHSVSIEMTITLFMAVSCVNFALLYYVILLRPGRLFRDVEFWTYAGILAGATTLVVGFGLVHGDFASTTEAVRYSLFQVTSILTNTGFGTHDFDGWNEFGRGLLFFLMFVGGCAGSTSCSIKVIRYLILAKALSLQTEQVYRPSVIRPLRLNGEPVEPEVVRDVIVYFATFLTIAVGAWLLLLAFEPDATWSGIGGNPHEKLMDCASGVAATINGVGPGLGTIGATRNYAHFQPASKLLLSFLMLLGRLEIFPILVLFAPRFWGAKQ